VDLSDLAEISPTNLIYDRILDAISDRKLRPGTRLKEEQLSGIFGVSRARVRQALTALERDGLVTILPNRGAIVAEPSIDEARDVFFARRVVEAGLIDRLCANPLPTSVERLRAHVVEERVARLRGDNAAIVRLGGSFHLLLAEVAGSRYLHDMLRDLVSRTALIKTMYQPRSNQDCGPDEHQHIVGAIARGDAEKAKQEMDHHLRHTENELDFDTSEDLSRDLREILG
jgi:DNA-binding GntR family transcriptional regulator